MRNLASKSPSVLLVRADASSAIGTGHVMRCLALAKAWQDRGGQVCFLMAESIPTLNERVRVEGFEREILNVEVGTHADAVLTADVFQRIGADWAVVDGYRFTPDYVRCLKASGLRVLHLDDDARFHWYPADLVLNSNSAARAEQYQRVDTNTKLLLGAQFTLLRPEFFSIQRDRPTRAPAQNVLVTLGGSDPENATLRVMRALLSVRSQIKAKVIVGAGNPHFATLQQFANRTSSQLELLRAQSDMARLMTWADLAISMSGGTSWELAFLGVPAILLVDSRDQEGNAHALSDQGAVINLGWHVNVSEHQISDAVELLLADVERRRRMSESGRRLIDGQGAQRVADFLLSLP